MSYWQPHVARSGMTVADVWHDALCIIADHDPMAY